MRRIYFSAILFCLFFSGNAQVFKTNGNQYINGSLGIGTTTPGDILTLCGYTPWVGQSIKSFSANGGAYIDFYKSNGVKLGGFTMDETTSSLTLRSYSGTNGKIKFQTNSTDRITINEVGNVSVGKSTTNPTTELLTVFGVIHAKEVRVDLTGFADFVFDPTYDLMPLTEVEQFVKTNRHLPEIPSATEVQEKGLNMGEMQNKLLQKIEELTLYVIEQQKRIEQLEKNQK